MTASTERERVLLLWAMATVVRADVRIVAAVVLCEIATPAFLTVIVSPSGHL